MTKDVLTKPIQLGWGIGRRALSLSAGLATFGYEQARNVVEEITDRRQNAEPYPTEGTTVPTAKGTVEVAVDEFGAVGSLTDNTGVEPDGAKPPFPGYDKLSGERVIAHVAESADLPDLQVLLAYEEAHKNRKGVVQAVEARLADLGAPAT
jgi:hypothetical protein